MITPYKGRGIDPAKRVFAYRNLHQAKWSLRQGGKVVAHADDVTLFGCQLKVSEAGRQRVLREKKKNVHAGVVGLVTDLPGDFVGMVPLIGSGPRKLSYNPYKAPSFTVRDEPVGMASYVHLDSEGKAWAIGGVG